MRSPSLGATSTPFQPASDTVSVARQLGEEYLLSRALFRRRATGEIVDAQFVRFLHPHVWRYDILRALDYFRDRAQHTGALPDVRLGEAISIVRSRQLACGAWPVDWRTKGDVWFTMDDGPGQRSAWITLKALRVLRWWDAHHEGGRR